jgi:hypothetical protein
MKKVLTQTFFAGLFTLILLNSGLVVRAQTIPASWSPPQLLYRSDQNVSNPLVVNDADDTVHVFWTESSSGETTTSIPTVIYHTELREGIWSRPTDILLAPGNESATAPEVSADKQGRLHLIFHGPNNTLYYTSVDARHAGEALAWTAPIAIATAWLNSGITVDDKGIIHVAYPGLGNQGVYYTQSSDGGRTWSDGVTIAVPHREDAAPDYAQLVVDSKGGIHVVWTEYQLPKSAPVLGSFYSHSFDEGMTWSPAVRMANGEFPEATIKRDPTDGLHIIWNGVIGLGGRYYTRSDDRGKTWSTPFPIVAKGIGGTSGYPDFVADATGTLHLATSIGEQVVYVRGQAGVWSLPVKISGNLNGLNSKSVELPRITVNQGNRLYAVVQNGFKEIYFMTAITDAPVKRSTAIPIANAPTATPVVLQSEGEKNVIPEYTIGDAPSIDASRDNANSLVAGFIPVILVIAVTLVAKWLRTRG